MLVADEELMAAIAGVDGGSVYLIAVAQDYTMEAAANHDCRRDGGAVAGSDVQHPRTIGIDQSPGDVASPAHTVGADEKGWLHT